MWYDMLRPLENLRQLPSHFFPHTVALCSTCLSLAWWYRYGLLCKGLCLGFQRRMFSWWTWAFSMRRRRYEFPSGLIPSQSKFGECCTPNTVLTIVGKHCSRVPCYLTMLCPYYFWRQWQQSAESHQRRWHHLALYARGENSSCPRPQTQTLRWLALLWPWQCLKPQHS